LLVCFFALLLYFDRFSLLLVLMVTFSSLFVFFLGVFGGFYAGSFLITMCYAFTHTKKELDPDQLPPLDEHGVPKYKGKKRGRKPKLRKRKRKVDPNRRKRQHTAYTLYVKETYPGIKAANPDFPSKDVISIVAKQWGNSVSAEEKRIWKQRALATHGEGEEDDDDEEEDDEEEEGENEDEEDTTGLMGGNASAAERAGAATGAGPPVAAATAVAGGAMDGASDEEDEEEEEEDEEDGDYHDVAEEDNAAAAAAAAALEEDDEEEDDEEVDQEVEEDNDHGHEGQPGTLAKEEEPAPPARRSKRAKKV
jgi:HMG (high mobility group) box